MLIIPTKVARACTHPAVTVDPSESYSGYVHVDHEVVDDELVASLISAAEEVHAKTYTRALKALASTRAGSERSCPHWSVALEMIETRIDQNFIDGWVYHKSPYGYIQPYRFDGFWGQQLVMRAVSTTFMNGMAMVTIERSTGMVDTLLARANLYLETPELKAAYQRDLQHFGEVTGSGFAQCILTGTSGDKDDYHSSEIDKIKVQSNFVAERCIMESPVGVDWYASQEVSLDDFDDDDLTVPTSLEDVDRPMPVLLMAEVFVMKSESTQYVATNDLALYVYDKDIRDRLILPAKHDRIINVLSANTTSGLVDVVQGKAAGNMVLCKGEPGLGKTLTAEVLSEVLGKPLYVVDASSVMSSNSIRRTMNNIYDRVRRWDGILLFDEADVLLGKRGKNMERNRITAELLRSIEGFEGLVFLTTNRPDDIDDAFESRSVALLTYTAPQGDDIVLAWQSVAKTFPGVTVSDEMGAALVDRFGSIAPRTMKQLLNLASQVATVEDREVDADLIIECAEFRGL